MARLYGITRDHAGKEFRLGELCIIGRGPEAQLQIFDRAVSRQHARIIRSDDAYIIEDMESGRGTKVNGLPVTASRLRPGDEVEIHGHRFRFEDAIMEAVATGEYPLVMDQTRRPRLLMEPVRTRVEVESGEVMAVAGEPESVAEDEPSAARQRRLEALVELNHQACSTADTTALLEKLLRVCLATFPGAERAMVALVEHRERRLSGQLIRLRPGVQNRHFHISRWAMTEVLGKGRAVLTSEPMKEAETREGRSSPPQVQKMVVPIRHLGRALGVLYLDRTDSRQPFTDGDLEACGAMAEAVALGLNGAELAEAVRVRSITDQQLEAARQVQKRFLPRGSPSLAGFSFVTHYHPCQNVGGDLYDFIQLDNDRLAVVVGDVAGKGLPAALLMAWVTSQLRVAAHQSLSPAQVLTQINRSLLEARHEELFVTLFYGVLDRWSMELRFCNAGHIPPLVRRAGGPGAGVETVEAAAGMPVGLLPEAEYEEGTISLGRGDVVLLVSDGVTEARGDGEQLFGMDRLRRAMDRTASSPADMVSDILGEVRAFSNGHAQADDITIVSLGVGGELADVRTTLPPGVMVPPLAREGRRPSAR